MIPFTVIKNHKGDIITKKQLFFTSDLHFSHKNLCLGTTEWVGESLKGCRDFETVEQMNNKLIANINQMVGEDDVLIHCGDWSFAGEENIKLNRDLINCKTIYGIQGNHDAPKNNHLYSEIFYRYEQLMYLSCEGFKMFVSHYPNVCWHNSNKGVPNIHGHCHGAYKHLSKGIDVGVDTAYKWFEEYRPFTCKEVENHLYTLPIYFESHHI